MQEEVSGTSRARRTFPHGANVLAAPSAHTGCARQPKPLGLLSVVPCHVAGVVCAF